MFIVRTEFSAGTKCIVPTLTQEAGAVTKRSHIHWMVTEYDAVDLFGKSVRRRVDALAGGAHPKFRDMLKYEAKKSLYI